MHPFLATDCKVRTNHQDSTHIPTSESSCNFRNCLAFHTSTYPLNEPRPALQDMSITALFMSWAIIFASCSCWPGHLLLDWSGCQAEIWESALSSRTTPQEHKWKTKVNQECNMLCRKRRYEMTPRNSRNSLLFQLSCYPSKFRRSFWYMWLKRVWKEDSREENWALLQFRV